MPLYARFVLLMLLMAVCCNLYAQQKKQTAAVRVSVSPKIDGNLDENSWNGVPIASGFIVYDPDNGKPSVQRTEVKIVYDNIALYVGATMYDTSPDSIFSELSKRDDSNVNTDYFAITLSPFNDGINALQFEVTAAGVQCDEKYSSDGEDPEWNAVWQSAVKKNSSGWTAEMKIPYSALRFPNAAEQVWGINFIRQIRRIREISTWNYINKEIDGLVTQCGKLTGISAIKPPLRLSVTPYISGYMQNSSESRTWNNTLNGGMDLKYGINESFTLDMTLIPDFGQVPSDDEILNLTPFETYYAEKRPFFTEGTELFNKGGIFYSRRIGSKPIGYDSVSSSLGAGEQVESNPSVTRLINATKVSGRTNKGLGIGFFNAMTSDTYATIADSLGNSRRVTTQPFTNYNMLVLDQTLKNSSYISLLNTDVLRDKYTANVTGTTFLFKNGKNSYSIGGSGFASQKYFPSGSPELGYTYSLSASKISGNVRCTLAHALIDNKYDPNDMGYLQKNNEISNTATLEYNIYKPVWKVLNWYNSMAFSYYSLFKPGSYVSFGTSLTSRTTFKNYLSAGLSLTVYPTDYNDFYEPRVAGRFYRGPAFYESSFWLSPDYRKRFLVDVNGGVTQAFASDLYSFNYEAAPRMRFGNRMLLIYSFAQSFLTNDRGYVNNSNDTIYFGRRNVNTITNTITAGYIFTNKSSLSFRLRYYWSTAAYNTFYVLNGDGSLSGSSYSGNHNINFNAFNIDLMYVWNFAPGSEMSVVWKNNIVTSGEDVSPGFFDNLNATIRSVQQNSFSLKVLYYLDYEYLMRRK